MIKYVVFDFDGTLVDSKEVFFTIFNQLAEKHNFRKVGQEDYESLRRLSIRQRCRYLNFPMYKIPFLALELYKLYSFSMQNMYLFNGIKSMLEELEKRGYRLAVISSNSEQNIREFLEKNGIASIKEIYCSNNIFGKDRMLKRFLKANKLKCTEVLYVGDEQRDVVACRKSDIKVVWVSWGYDESEIVMPESPDYVVHSPEEILQLV